MRITMEGIDFHFKKAIMILLGNSFTEEKRKHAPGILIAFMACHSRLHKLESLQVENASMDNLSDDGDKACNLALQQ